MNNYDGILDQVIRFIYETPEILKNETDFINALKNRLNIEFHKNKSEYLLNLRNSEEHFNNLFQISINKILSEQVRIENQSKNEYYTPLEIANILNITKRKCFYLDKIWLTTSTTNN